MAIFLRILIPILLFPLVRWGIPRIIGLMSRRYDRQQEEKHSEGPVIEGRLSDLSRPTRDLRDVDFDRE